MQIPVFTKTAVPNILRRWGQKWVSLCEKKSKLGKLRLAYKVQRCSELGKKKGNVFF